MPLWQILQQVWPRIIIWDVGRYVLATSLFAGIVALVATSRWRVRRIQDRTATAADYRREILSSLRTCMVFAAVGVGIIYAQTHNVLHKPPPSPGLGFGLVLFIAMMVAQDTYFYWTHRAMHHPKLFRRMHRLHHQSVTPTPFAAYAFNTSEAVVQALFVVLWITIVPTPQVIVMSFMIVMIVRNAWGHSGYEMHPRGMADHPVFGQLTTTVHHDLHHGGGFTHNYGLWFTWWDRWMGTEHPQYHARYRALTSDKTTTDAIVTASFPAE